jgi:hypothetical protein
MIDYEYPTIASRATPIGSAGRAPEEESLWGEWGRKFRGHELDIYSHRESGFKNPKISGSRRIEIKNWINQRFQEVEDWRFEVFETQPESATWIESQGLLTWECPSGTYGLVYRARPIKEEDKNKDSKVDLE